MKKLLLLVLCVIVPMAGFAQKKKKKKGAEPVEVAPAVVPLTDEECLEKVSLFQSFVKIGDWSAAYENWLPVYQSRPDFRSQIYTNGAKILDYRYQNAATDEAKLALRDSIMKLHDDRIKYFDDAKYPDAYVLGMKGLDYLTYYPEDELALPAYGWLKESVNGLGTKTQVSVLRKYIELSYNLFKSNNDTYGDQFLADYQLVTGLLEQIAQEGGKNAESASEQKAYVDRLYAASGAADCGQMDQMYASIVAESSSDIEKLGSIMKLYRRMGCTESDVYFAAAESVHKLQPTSESAAGLAQRCMKKNDINGAISYYKQALNLVVDKNEKADYLYLLANIYLSLKNYQQAVNYAKQALTITPNDGRCYILMGVCYSTAKMHSEDPVLSRCVYWVACDMFEKAKQVDSSCAADANKLIATYKQYFPSKEDIFFHREVNEGSSFHVGGWIDRTTTCRSK